MTSPPPESLEQLTSRVCKLLEGVLEGSTAASAVCELKSLVCDARLAFALTHILATHTSEHIRQLSALILRRRLKDIWPCLSKEDRVCVKHTLVSRLCNDTQTSVRMSIVYAIGRIAAVSKTGEEISIDMLQQFHTLSDDTNADNRHIAQAVFAEITLYLPAHLEAFSQIFHKGLQDASSEKVQLAALRGVASISTHLSGMSESECVCIREIMKPAVMVVYKALQNSQEETVSYALDTFDDMIQRTHIFQSDDLSDMIMFMLQVCQHVNMNTAIKGQALNIIHWIARNKPNVIIKKKLVESILNIVVPMGVMEDPPGFEDDDLDDDLSITPHRIAAQCIDSLAQYLPSKFVYPAVIEKLGPYTHSSDIYHKRGALVLLGIMSEGCCDLMHIHLHTLMPFVLSSFNDASHIVRGAAGVCLGQMYEYLHPHTHTYNTDAMTAILTCLNTCEKTCKDNVAYALQIVLESCDDVFVEKWLPQLVPITLQIITNDSDDIKTKEKAFAVIASAIEAGKEKFIPYLDKVLPLIQAAMEQTSDKFFSLRSMATLTAGTIINKLPTQYWMPFTHRFLERVLQTFPMDNCELRESAYRFLSTICGTLKDDMAEMLPRVMSWVVASCLSTEGLKLEYDEAHTQGMMTGFDDKDDNAEDEFKKVTRVSIRSVFVDEQLAAIDCLKSFYEHISYSIIHKYTRKTCEVVDELHKCFMFTVRQETPWLMQAVLLNCHKGNPTKWSPTDSNPPSKAAHPKTLYVQNKRGNWTPGLPCQTPLHTNTMALWTNNFAPVFKEMLFEEENEEVVGDVCDVFGQLLMELGPHLLNDAFTNDPHAELFSAIYKLLEEQHPCQEHTAGQFQENEDTRALEEVLYDDLSNLISGIAACMGPQFRPIFDSLHPKLLKWTKHKQSIAYRRIGLGCYGDIFKAMQRDSLAYIKDVLHAAMHAIKEDIDDSLTLNSVYCMGVIFELGASEAIVLEQLNPFLQRVQEILQEPVEVGGLAEGEALLRDNAVSAVCRILMGVLPSKHTYNCHALVPLVLENIPLREDNVEIECVAKCLAFLPKSEMGATLEAHIENYFARATMQMCEHPQSISKATAQDLTDVLKNAFKAVGPNAPVVMSVSKALQKSPESLKFFNSVFA